MNRTSKQFLVTLDVVSDWLLILGAYLLSSWLWLDVFKDTRNNMAFASGLRGGAGFAACIYALALVILLACFRVYRVTDHQKPSREVLHIAGANVLGVFGIGAALYLFRLQDFSRGVLFLFLVLSTVFACLKHALLRHIINRMFIRGYFHKNVLLVGAGPLALQFEQDVEASHNPRLSVKGYLGDQPNPAIAVKWLGGFDVMEKQLLGSLIDEAVLALEAEESTRMRAMIALCEKCGTRASVIPFYNDMILSTPQVEIVGRTKLLNLRSNQLDNLGFAVFKRTGDILASALSLVLLSPLFLAVSIGVKLSSPGPVFFKQQRVGLNKKVFTMYKFRSMRLNDVEDTAWTTRGDPRKTRFGSFLRKCSIDELPQLYNVFRGDMSLVGPRPERPHFVERFREEVPLYMVKHQVRPGITGWAQVNGYRGDTSIEKRIEHDIWYIDHMSMGLDIKILWMTIFGGGWLNQENVAKEA